MLFCLGVDYYDNFMKYQECSFDETIIKPLIQIDPPPTHLWYRGKIPEPKFEKGIVAIVGSRRATRYGEQIAYDLAYNLAKLGVIIVSGLAYGIDSCAHRGCL